MKQLNDLKKEACKNALREVEEKLNTFNYTGTPNAELKAVHEYIELLHLQLSNYQYKKNEKNKDYFLTVWHDNRPRIFNRRNELEAEAIWVRESDEYIINYNDSDYGVTSEIVSPKNIYDVLEQKITDRDTEIEKRDKERMELWRNK